MHYLKFVFFLFLTQVFISCSWHKERRPSVLLVAVDSLAFDHAICSPNRPAPVDSGIQTLCDESVRFTHAYTPSVLSQPALASLLTARYPHENGVWHNGSKFLSAKFITSAEYAVESGYRTSFFSGGPPIWSFSGLNQGFELFSDHVSVRHSRLYRPASEVFAHLFGWIERESRDHPFFSVVFLSDLQFKDEETVNNLGEVRPRTYESQLLEVDESLGYLIRKLKEKGLWDSTNLILAGLNGVANPQKPRELKGFNLFSSNSEVALYVKPAGKKRDLGIQWKIDKNVSLVDVGATIFSMIGKEPPAVPGRTLSVVSLDSVLKEPTAEWDKNRMIFMESAWSQWRGFGNSRFAMRVGHLLYLYDEELSVYNTFVDHLESAPIAVKDPQVMPYSQKVMDYMVEHGFEPWSTVSHDLIDKWRVGSELWQDKPTSPEVILALQGLHERRPWDDQIVGWMASLALKRGAWKELRELAVRTRNNQWLYFADRALGKDVPPPAEGCLALFAMISRPLEKPSPKLCDHRHFVTLMMWLSRLKDPQTRDWYLARFLRRYRIHFLDQKIYQTNLRNQLLWNVDTKYPAGPDISDLTLSLPEFKDQREKVLGELGER